jgi:putative membrane protein
MNGLMLRWLILTVAILITSYLVEGIIVSGFFTAIFAAAVLGILNAFLRPIALILTLPINILSLGLFTFVINAIMLKMASGIIPGFSVNGFWAAGWGAFLVSIISWVLNSFVNEKGNVQYIELKHKGGNRWE